MKNILQHVACVCNICCIITVRQTCDKPNVSRKTLNQKINSVKRIEVIVKTTTPGSLKHYIQRVNEVHQICFTNF